MKNLPWFLLIILINICGLPLSGQNLLPHLAEQGTATQLIVEGKPFLILGGELGNSSATTMQYMQPIWAKLQALHLNTVLVPV